MSITHLLLKNKQTSCPHPQLVLDDFLVYFEFAFYPPVHKIVNKSHIIQITLDVDWTLCKAKVTKGQQKAEILMDSSSVVKKKTIK